MTAERPFLFQFWDTSRAPQDVEQFMRSWAADPAFVYRRFDADDADVYIDRYFDYRTLAAFRKCDVPAMQADFFRYCALYQEGGAYVDADTYNAGGLQALIAPHSRGVLMNRQKRIANDFLFVRTPGDRLFERTIEQAVLNIEKEISQNVWVVTGPGVMTTLHNTPETQKLFEGFHIEDVRVVREIVKFRNDLEYKTQARDWRQRGVDGNSIFKGLR